MRLQPNDKGTRIVKNGDVKIQAELFKMHNRVLHEDL